MNIAILIGCSEYDDPEVGSLRYAAADAALFRQTLLESCPITADNVLLLSSDGAQRPTKSNIIRLVRQTVAARRGDLDTVFVLFSGHGFRSERTSTDFLLPEDAVFSDLEDTGISIPALLHYISDGLPRHILFFIDACRNPEKGGKSISHPGWKPPDMQGDTGIVGSGIVVFASCAPTQRSYEVEALEAGIFTAAVCDGLSEEGQCKSVYELDHYLSTRVPELCRLHRKPQQTPYTRIEPLRLQSLVLVSDTLVSHWQGASRIGSERRPRRIGTSLSIERERPWCAIDFGTSHSVIALLDDQKKVTYVPSMDGRAFVPSVVCFEDDLSYSVGVEAIERARVQPSHAVFAPKRLLGTDDFVEVAGRALAPELVVSLILRSLRRNAEELLRGPIGRVIASVPADFGIARSNALARAFELADIELFRLIGEPCAASVLLEGLSDHQFRAALIVDLGGGTCDVSIVETGEDIAEIFSVAGDNFLGGLDFDDVIVEYVKGKVQEKLPPGVVLSPADEFTLRREAERAKHALSLRAEASVTLHNLELPGHGFTTIDVPIDRATLADVTAPLIARLDECVNIAFRRTEGKYSRDNVTAVMLAGQGSKAFPVAQYMRQHFGDRVIDTYQESAVIRGLGEYLAVLEGRGGGVLILDANYSSIGIACMEPDDAVDANVDATISNDPLRNRSVFTLLAAGTSFPTITQRMTVRCQDAKDGRGELTVVELGTRETERFVVTSMEVELRPGKDLMEVVMDVDGNRTIHLAARALGSEMWQVVQLNNHFKQNAQKAWTSPGPVFARDWQERARARTERAQTEAQRRR